MFQLILQDKFGQAQALALAGDGPWILGSEKGVSLQIPATSVAAKHAVLRLQAGRFVLENLDGKRPTRVGARRLAELETAEIALGQAFTLGDVKLWIRDAAAAEGAGTAPRSGLLVEWWEWSEPELDFEHEDTWRECRNACALHWARDARGQSPDKLIRELMRRQAAPELLAQMPLAPSVVADLALSIWFAPPHYRSFAPGAGELTADVLSFQRHVLKRLARDPTIDRVRERLQEQATDETRLTAASRLARLIQEWWREAWLRLDVARLVGLASASGWPTTRKKLLGLAGGQPDVVVSLFERLPEVLESSEQLGARLDAEMRHVLGGPARWVPPNGTSGFLRRLVEVTGQSSSGKLFKPIQSFFLRASTRIPEAFLDYEGVLIDECLATRDLEEHFLVRPVRLDLEDPDVLVPEPGDNLEIRSVRVANTLDRLPDAVPQEFVQLADPEGRRSFLQKLTSEGFLIWHRNDRVHELTRKKILVCFVADVGRAADGSLWSAESEKDSSASLRARRLIFECLRDIAQNVEIESAELELHVFLEPVEGDAKKRRHWFVSLDELREIALGELQDFMVEVELRCPGYYYYANRDQDPGDDPLEFLQDELPLRQVDCLVCVFLGPAVNVRALVPGDAPTLSAKSSAIRVVEVDAGLHRVLVSSGRSFQEAEASLRSEPMLHPQFRAAVVEDVLGRRSESAEAPAVRLELGP